MARKKPPLTTAHHDDPLFNRFWNAYPKRQAKFEAYRAFCAVQPTDAMVDQMVAALLWQREQPSWLKENGQFIPLPASWIRGGRWFDEQPQGLMVQGQPQRSKLTEALARASQEFLGS